MNYRIPIEARPELAALVFQHCKADCGFKSGRWTLEEMQQNVIDNNIQHLLISDGWLGWDSATDKQDNSGHYTNISLGAWLALAVKPTSKSFQHNDFNVTLFADGSVKVNCTTLNKEDIDVILKERANFLLKA